MSRRKNSSLNRKNPNDAARVFAYWPRRLQLACARQLARAIEVANDAAESSWQVSLMSWGVRLNVGQVRCLDFFPDGIEAIIKTTKGKSFYSAVKTSSRLIKIPFSQRESLSSKQWKQHEKFIRYAASAKKTSPWKESFSEGVMLYVEKILKKELPRPSYRSRPMHILQGGIKNGDKAWLEGAAGRKQKRSSWVAPSSALIGDQAVIYVQGIGMFATARIAGSPKPKSDWANRYGAAIDQIKLIVPPISIEEIRRQIPSLKWSVYPRSVHSLSAENGRALKELIDGRADGLEEKIEIQIRNDKSLEETEREAVIRARKGQGKFREDLIVYWKNCAVTGSNIHGILRASHIKPWKDCETHSERLNAFNGLLLVPNLDALFDCALISFDTSGKIRISKRLPKLCWSSLGLSKAMKIKLDKRHHFFLEHHRERFDVLENSH